MAGLDTYPPPYRQPRDARRARDVLEAPLRRARLVLGLVSVASLGALAVSFLVSPRYRASAHVQAEWGDRADAGVSSIAAELAERRLRVVRQRVATLWEERVEVLSAAVSVRAGEADAFFIECVHADPSKAALVSNRLASLLIEEAERERAPGVEGGPLVLEARVTGARKAMEDKAEALLRFRKGLPDVSSAGRGEIDATVEKAKEELERLARDYDQALKAHHALQEQWRAAEANKGRVRFAVVRPASAPRAPSYPDRLLFALAGAVLGLVLGLGAAFVAELRDKSVKGPDDLRELFPQPLLAELPFVRVRRFSRRIPTRPGADRG